MVIKGLSRDSMVEVIGKDIVINIENIRKHFHNPSDLKFREMKFGWIDTDLAVVYIEGIVDPVMLEESVINRIAEADKAVKGKNLIEYLTKKILTTPSVEIVKDLNKFTDSLLNGNAVVIVDGFSEGISVNVTQWKERSLEESLGERSLKGIVIGFTERASTNISVLRSIVKTANLCIMEQSFGTESKTSVYLLYIEGTVDKGILKEVQKRMKDFSVKYMIEGFVLEKQLAGKPHTLFPMSQSTERPDVVASQLFEGRVALIVDGSPKVITAPALFMDFLTSSDEYYSNYGRFSIRLIRLLSFISSIFLPGVYVALDHVDKKRIPKKAYEILITKDEFIPTFWEVFILFILLRIILDTSVRLPKGISMTISFIGSILIGQTAVEAKLVHPVSILVVGITVILSMVLGNKGLSGAIITLRTTSIFIGHFFGIIGLIVMGTSLFIYMTSLKSIGVPYLSPYIPLRIKELKDSLYRGDIKTLINSQHSYPEE